MMDVTIEDCDAFHFPVCDAFHFPGEALASITNKGVTRSIEDTLRLEELKNWHDSIHTDTPNAKKRRITLNNNIHTFFDSDEQRQDGEQNHAFHQHLARQVSAHQITPLSQQGKAIDHAGEAINANDNDDDSDDYIDYDLEPFDYCSPEKGYNFNAPVSHQIPERYGEIVSPEQSATGTDLEKNDHIDDATHDAVFDDLELETINDFGARVFSRVSHLTGSMEQSLVSQGQIVEWDNSMGLKKCQSRTMMSTRKSRQNVQNFLKTVVRPQECYHNDSKRIDYSRFPEKKCNGRARLVSQEITEQQHHHQQQHRGISSLPKHQYDVSINPAGEDDATDNDSFSYDPEPLSDQSPQKLCDYRTQLTYLTGSITQSLNTQRQLINLGKGMSLKKSHSTTMTRTLISRLKVQALLKKVVPQSC